MGFGTPPTLNKTFIALVPKVKKPTHSSQFRPISLCNVIFKLITKTIANRLKVILPSIVSINQSVLVPGRLITDSALVAFETFYYLNTKKTGMNEKLYGVEA